MKLSFNLPYMNKFITTHGIDAFNDAVFHGAFSEVAFDYIHPEDELRITENFDIIQRAFIRAYV